MQEPVFSNCGIWNPAAVLGSANATVALQDTSGMWGAGTGAWAAGGEVGAEIPWRGYKGVQINS